MKSDLLGQACLQHQSNGTRSILAQSCDACNEVRCTVQLYCVDSSLQERC